MFNVMTIATACLATLLGVTSAAAEVEPSDLEISTGAPASERLTGDEAWRSYAESLRAALLKAWVVPDSARRGDAGLVTVDFRIYRDGVVERVALGRHEASWAQVRAALQAVPASRMVFRSQFQMTC